MIELLILQLFTYTPLNWLLFVGVAFLASYYGGVIGIFGGHFLIAFIVFWLDLEFAYTHDYMDTDFVFTLGLLTRIVLINSVLLIISGLGLALRKRKKKRIDLTIGKSPIQ